MAAGASEPGDADALAKRESVHLGALVDDHADDLVAEHQRQSRLSQIAVHDVQVGAADAAGAYLEQDLIGTGCWPRHFGQPQGLALSVEKHGFHGFLLSGCCWLRSRWRGGVGHWACHHEGRPILSAGVRCTQTRQRWR